MKKNGKMADLKIKMADLKIKVATICFIFLNIFQY